MPRRQAPVQLLLLQILSVIVEKGAGLPTCPTALCQQIFFLTQDLPEAREGQSQKPEGQEFPNLISHLCFLDQAL